MLPLDVRTQEQLTSGWLSSILPRDIVEWLIKATTNFSSSQMAELMKRLAKAWSASQKQRNITTCATELGRLCVQERISISSLHPYELFAPSVSISGEFWDSQAQRTSFTGRGLVTAAGKRAKLVLELRTKVPSASQEHLMDELDTALLRQDATSVCYAEFARNFSDQTECCHFLKQVHDFLEFVDGLHGVADSVLDTHPQVVDLVKKTEAHLNLIHAAWSQIPMKQSVFPFSRARDYIYHTTRQPARAKCALGAILQVQDQILSVYRRSEMLSDFFLKSFTCDSVWALLLDFAHECGVKRVELINSDFFHSVNAYDVGAKCKATHDKLDELINCYEDGLCMLDFDSILLPRTGNDGRLQVQSEDLLYAIAEEMAMFPTCKKNCWVLGVSRHVELLKKASEVRNFDVVDYRCFFFVVLPIFLLVFG